jgi:hypothetical protein
VKRSFNRKGEEDAQRLQFASLAIDRNTAWLKSPNNSITYQAMIFSKNIKLFNDFTAKIALLVKQNTASGPV